MLAAHLQGVHVPQEAEADRLQGLPGPGLEAVNGGAADQGREAAAVEPQPGAHGGQAQRNLQSTGGH